MAQQLPVKIAGLGWYLPERRVSSAGLAQRLKLAPGVIERTASVLERRYASGETAWGMGAAATRMAREHAGLEPNDIDAIIGASSAPRQCISCTAALVQRDLQATEGRSLCFDSNATCLSFLAAMQTAAQFIPAGVYRFQMQGLALFRQAVRIMRPFVDLFFDTFGWQREQVDSVVPDQASRHGVEQLSDRLAFRDAQVFTNLREGGDCVAASMPLALAEAVHIGRIQRNDRVVLLGTRVGLAVGALALTF